MPNLLAAAPPPRAGMEWADYAIVVFYFLLTAGIVWWSSRKESDTEQFFLGGRRMPWFAVGLSIMATLLSTITYLGMPGELIKNGITAMSMYLAYPLVFIVVFWLFVPFFMRLRLTSAYEYLDRRFNYATRVVGGVLFFFLRIGWIALVMYTAAMALEGMSTKDLRRLLEPFGLEDQVLYVVIVALGLTATVYAFFGGMRAVVWTDVLQAVMLFGGALVIIFYVMATTGTGIGTWWDVASAQTQNRMKPILFDMNPTVRLTVFTVVLDGFFWNICTHGSDQVVLQRYFTTTSVRAARNSFLINIVAQLAIGILLMLAGLALLYFYLVNKSYLGNGLSIDSSADKVMPYFYAHQLPLGFGGLILANFMCDAMQTLVSGVNSMTAVATDDLFAADGTQRTAAETDRRQLHKARTMTIGIGLFCTLLAVGTAYLAQVPNGPNIYDLLPRTFNMFLGPLASLFFVGMFLPQATARSAIPAATFALTVSFFWNWWEKIIGTHHAWYQELFGSTAPPSIKWGIFLPCSIGFVAADILSIYLDKDPNHPGRRYSWRNVMKLPAPAET